LDRIGFRLIESRRPCIDRMLVLASPSNPAHFADWDPGQLAKVSWWNFYGWICLDLIGSWNAVFIRQPQYRSTL
jgi:hypothetical protein